MRRYIVLIGMMGAGKTAVGTELARKLALPFIDTDAEIERAAAMTIPEIFARDGEEFFRARESEVLDRVLAGTPCVISTGGGAWMAEANRKRIAARGVSVWLDCDLKTLWHRVRLRPTRPLLQTADPYGTLKRLYDERLPTYALADLRITIERPDTIESTARRVLDAVRSAHPDMLETS